MDLISKDEYKRFNLTRLPDGKEAVKIEISLNSGFAGQRVDLALKKVLKRYSRERIKKIIQSGFFTLDGSVMAKPAHKIPEEGALVTFLRPLPEEPEDVFDIPVIFQNNDFLILNKPGNLTIHPTSGRFRRTLTWWMWKNGFDDYIITHRLDRETGGIVVCARRGKVAAKIKEIFRRRKVEKTYLALLRGILTRKIEHRGAVAPDENSPIIIKQKVVTTGGKKAHSVFQPFYSGQNTTMAGICLHTGRMHQIRVHAQNLGFPVWGDKIYGVEPEIYLGFTKTGPLEKYNLVTGYHRHLLHCALISFTCKKRKFEFFAPPPADFKEFCNNKDIDYGGDQELKSKLTELTGHRFSD
ncbi:MAG: RluA family pseudouridine synthase [Deltaproteobacteria bacterium]|jgi:RluA family pseudouridine synthase|nr:RluA family pseudouridine synthase [Deltaproteobacteria bacterium]